MARPGAAERLAKLREETLDEIRRYELRDVSRGDDDREQASARQPMVAPKPLRGSKQG